MIDFAKDFMTKAQVDGVKELIDLCHNGYMINFSSKIQTAVVYGLRHQRNGRKLTMFIGSYHYSISENGKRIKMVVYDDDGKIISTEN